MNRALVIVPHQDDEINVAGSQIYHLTKIGWQVFVLYTTNGDFEYKKKYVRLREAIDALGVLGVEKDNIIFLGYGDRWGGRKHLYNAEDEKQVFTSYAGFRKTYGLEDHAEYCYRQTGQHNLYTRENYKKDLKHAILDIHPELIFCVDFDSHCDHRATSLFFEEVMGEILKETVNFFPVVLKSFAYAGKWDGYKDYHSIPLRPVLPPQRELVLDYRYQMDVPAYAWDDRIRVKTHMDLQTSLLSYNPLFKAAKMHKSQPAWYFALRTINGDNVFWNRRTDNLMMHAKCTATSGDVTFLNDFKIIDCLDVCCTSRKAEEVFSNFLWIPDSIDKQKKIMIELEEKQDISVLVFYENFSAEDNINELEIKFDNGYLMKLTENMICHDGKATIVHFPMQRAIKEICIRILQYEGKLAGISELEIYKELENPQLKMLPFEFDTNLDYDIFYQTKWYQYVERFCMDIRYLLTEKWKLI